MILQAAAVVMRRMPSGPITVWSCKEYLFTATLLTTIFFPTNIHALTCICNDCGDSTSECSVEDGGACFSKVTLMNGVVAHQKRCFDTDFAQSQCNLKFSNIAIECCYEDLCNRNLEATLEPNVNKTSTTSTGGSNSSFVNPLNPDEHHENKTNEEPKITVSLLCHKSNTKKKTDKVLYCATNHGRCFHFIRKSANGTVMYEKQGCMESCQEENRNRAVRRCCNTTLCNAIEVQTTSSTPSSPSLPKQSRNVLETSIATVQTILPFPSAHIPSISITKSTGSSVSTDTTVVIPITKSTGSSDTTVVIPITKSTGSSDTTVVIPITKSTGSSDTTVVIPITKSTGSSVSTDTTVIIPITKSTGSSDTTVVIPMATTHVSSRISFSSSSSSSQLSSSTSTSSLNSKATATVIFSPLLQPLATSLSTAPSLSSSSKIYIAASASLGFLYIVVLVALCMLIAIVCYRQRKLILNGNLEKDVKSTDTLTSISV